MHPLTAILGFTQPLFLIGLSALALPWLIHRINRARPLAWRFPSILRIPTAPLPRHGRRSVTDLLLMLLRMLIVSLIVLILAGPYWQPPAASLQPTGQLRVVLLDQSASMDGWQAMPQAQAALDAEAATWGSEDKVGWLFFSDRTEQEVEPQAGARERLMDAVAAAQPRSVAGDPAAALLAAAALVPQGATAELIIVSDFQSSDWNQSLPAPPAFTSIRTLRVGMPRTSNWTIQNAHALPASGTATRARVDVFNHGDQAGSASIELSAGNQLSRATMEVDARSSASVVMQLDGDNLSAHAIATLTAEADPYHGDNAFHFRISPPPALSVIALTPDAEQPDAAEEMFFVEQAFTSASIHEWVRFSLLPARAANITPQSLQRVAAVWIPAATAAGIEQATWQLLDSYVRDGGLVVMTMDNTAVRALQRMSAAGADAGRYLGRAGRGNDPRQRFFIGSIAPDAPLADVFTDGAERDLFLVNLRDYLRIELPEGALPWLRAENGDPLLYELPRGAGAWLISTFPWHTAASDLPLRSSFLPLVRESVSRAALNAGGIRRLNTHDPLPDEVAMAGFNSSTPTVFTFRDQVFEINHPRSESTTDTITAELIRMRLDTALAATGEPTMPASADSIPMLPWLLAALLLAWLLETCLAAYLIRPRPQS
jgi:hypothetical protein